MEFNVLSGSDAGRVFSGNVTVATIGRGSGNLVALSDPKISRQHARLEVTAAGVSITDLGSTNGTFVNGQRLAGRTAQPLQPGDEVRVGDTRLRFMGLAAAVPGWGDLPEDQVYAATPGGRPRWLIPALAIVALLLFAAAAVWLLTGDSGDDVSNADATRTAEAPVIVATPDTPTPVTFRTATASSPPADSAQPPAEGVGAPPAPPGLPGQGEQPGAAPPGLPGQGEQPGIAPPGLPGQGEQPGIAPPGLPGQGEQPGGGLPLAPGQPGGAAGGGAASAALAQPNPATLEQIPLPVAMLFPGVSPEQLPQAIGQAAAGGQLTSAQAQVVASQLFPGVPAQQLPQVIQSSFPGVPANQMQAVFDLLFPGQGVSVPGASPLSGAIFYSTLTPEGRYQVYQINVDGSGRQLVLEDASEPAISPDRQWLAYYSWRPDALGLRLHNLVTGEDRQLTADNNDSYPSWAPEQSRLAFWNYAADTVHTINFDGSDRRQIAKGEFAAWSPAGDRVAFKGCVDGGRCGIVLANPDGGNPTLLTTYANDGQPAWSPDGRALTFVSDREGNWDIYAINADGSWLRRITDNPTTDGLPEWSLDGTRIAFRSDRDGRWAIWVASGVGGPATKLVDADTGSRWQWEKISWK